MTDALLLPYATPGVPGCGGRLRERPADFQVEELPKYPYSGTGEHLLVEVEKQGLTTHEAIRRICAALGLLPRRVGHAGLKDARAVARQWLSLHTPGDPPLQSFEGDGLRVVRVTRHGNKLRPGHLAGNRFEIVVRDVRPPDGFTGLLERVAAHGFPNYFGLQRFGARGDNAVEGRRLLREGFARRPGLERTRMVTNAYQAALFNDLVAHRLRLAGRLEALWPGDVAVFRDSHACFAVTAESLEESTARCEAGEISPSAPLFGYKVDLAEGVPGGWERAVLAAEGLELEHFRAGGKRLAAKGERRAVRAFAAEFTWEPFQDGALPCLRLRFTLGAGVYATSLLREVMKNDGQGHALEQPLPPPPPEARHGAPPQIHPPA